MVLFVFPQQATLKSTMPIVKKFSGTIKHLLIWLIAKSVDFSDIVDILSLVPNVEHLSLRVNTFVSRGYQPPKKRRLDDLNLNQLHTLVLENCSDDIWRLFDRLPQGVLKELSISNVKLNEFDELFKRQYNIKKLTVHGPHLFNENRSQLEVAVHCFDHLNLETLDWQQDQFKFNTSEILSNQPKLKSLRLCDIVDANVMNVVTNRLTDLESLTFDVSSTPAGSVANIKKLKNLKHLGVEYMHNRNMVLFDAITKLDNSRISTMNIANFTNITADQIRALSLSAPKLKILRCKYDQSTFGTVMKNFNFVEVLRFTCYSSPRGTVIDWNDNYFEESCINPNLIELSLTMPYETIFIEKLVDNFPNLGRLEIKSITPITSLELQMILNGFEKLESLIIKGGAWQPAQSDNLTFLSLVDKHHKFTTIKEEFGGIFHVVKVKPGNLTMAVDTETFIREKNIQSRD